MSIFIRWNAFVAPALVIVSGLLACEPPQAGEEPTEEPAAAEQMEPELAEDTATVTLNPLNEAGVAGEVVFTSVDDTLTVAVRATHLDDVGDYPSHIHYVTLPEGTCESPGGVAVPLESPRADEEGVGEAVTQVSAAQLEGGSSYLVMVHDLEGTPVACAEIPESIVEGSG